MEEINANVKPLSLLYPDPVVQQQVQESITSNPEEIFKELHPLTKAGSERITLWANFRLPDGVVINLGYDVTERKLAERELSRLNNELNEKNKEMEQVVYPTSHDLRSPLVNIQGFSGEMGELLNDMRSFLENEKIFPSVKNKIGPIMEDEIPKALEVL